MLPSQRGCIDWFHTFSIALHQQGLHSPSRMQTALSMMSDITRASYACIILFGYDGEIDDAYTLRDEDGSLTRHLWSNQLLQSLISEVQTTERVVIQSRLTDRDDWGHLREVGLTPPSTALALPIMKEKRVTGVVVLLHGKPDGFPQETVELLLRASEILGPALAHARQYEQALHRLSQHAEQERLRNDLTAMVYHDLRGPLQNILGSLSRLERMVPAESGPLHALLGVANRSSRQLSRMIKSLLDIERLEGDESVVNLQPLSLRSVLCEAADLVGVLAHEAEQALSVEIDDHLHDIEGDHDMLVRVVTNLLENAIKHTPAGGHIALSASSRDGGVRVSISDTGPGIPAQMQNEIFDKFVRLKRDRLRDGYGLGLAFCRLAVEAHGGHIWVESSAYGGAVFSFELPAIREALVA
jgi:signal transduction histidine kinase